MKQLLFIFVFCWVLVSGNVWAEKANSAKPAENLWLTTNLNICCRLSITAEGINIDEQETSGLDGLDHFAYLPDIQLNLLSEGRFSLVPVILFSHHFKVLTLLTDLPPPVLS